MTSPFRVVRVDDDSYLPTLSDAFSDLFLPHLHASDRSKDTIQSYRRYVAAWDSYWELLAAQDGTTYPVLTEIAVTHLDQWRNHLIEDRKFTPRNANKYVGGIEAILARCESRGAIDCGGRYRIDKTPRLGRLGEKNRAPKLYFRFLQRVEQKRLLDLANADRLSPAESGEMDQLRQLDHLSRLYVAASRATWPRTDRHGHGINTRHHWQAALVLYATYGFRTEELIAYTCEARPLPWSQVSWDVETPATGYHATNAHGWLWYVPEKQAWAKSDPLVLPLSSTAAEHLRRVLPWPDDYRPDESQLARPIFDWPASNYSFYRQWAELIQTAGFALKRDLKTGTPIKLLPKHLRKTCTTWHNYWRPGIAPLITGHADRDSSANHQPNQIVADHYDNAEFAVVEAISALPVPEAWQATRGDVVYRQARLF